MLTKDKVNLFNALSKLNGDKLTHVLKHIDSKGIESVCECVFNTIYTDMKLSGRKKKNIKTIFSERKSRKNLNIITNKAKNSEKKRRALIQEGKGIFTILATVAPLLASLFSRKTHK